MLPLDLQLKACSHVPPWEILKEKPSGLSRRVGAETKWAQLHFVKFLSLLFQSLQLKQWEKAVFRFSAKLKCLPFPSPQKFNLRFNETFNLKQYILIWGEAIFWIKVNKVINYLLFFNLDFFSKAISWIQGETNVWDPIYLHRYIDTSSNSVWDTRSLAGEAFLGRDQAFGTLLILQPQIHISILLCTPASIGAVEAKRCCSSFYRQRPAQSEWMVSSMGVWQRIFVPWRTAWGLGSKSGFTPCLL